MYSPRRGSRQGQWSPPAEGRPLQSRSLPKHWEGEVGEAHRDEIAPWRRCQCDKDEGPESSLIALWKNSTYRYGSSVHRSGWPDPDRPMSRLRGEWRWPSETGESGFG